MKQYLDGYKDIINLGIEKENRTGISTTGVFGMNFRYNLADGFPILTTKKINFEMVKGELLWFINGSSDVNKLKEIMGTDTTIWDANAEADYWKPKAKFPGDLGRVYGVQWRHWRLNKKMTPENFNEKFTLDQLGECIENIKAVKEDPTLSVARRLIVTAWNPGELDQMALPPCHMFFQFSVREDSLDVQMYQRSCDYFLGVPFNISSYSLLLQMVAQVTGLRAGEFIHILGDAHVYKNHWPAVMKQLERDPYPLPELKLNPDINSIDDFRMEDIHLENYQYHPHIKATMAV